MKQKCDERILADIARCFGAKAILDNDGWVYHKPSSEGVSSFGFFDSRLDALLHWAKDAVVPYKVFLLFKRTRKMKS